MFLLGLVLAICYVPGYTGAFIPSQWVLLSAVLPLGLWRSGSLDLGHWAGLVALTWSAISFLWAPSTYDWGYGLWLLCILAGAFWLGSTLSDLKPIFCGLALGLSVSSGVAIAQAFGYTPIESSSIHPSGLLYNSTLLGCTVAIALIACCTYRLWWYIPGLLPALVLSNSRGALVVLAMTALATRVHWTILLATLIIGGGLLTLSPSASDIQRLYLWGIAIRELTPYGHGIGSFATYLFYNPTEFYGGAIGLFHPGFVHNDYLQLWFELGLGAIAIYAIYGICLSERQSPHWPIFFAFALFSLFYFPLYSPIPAFIGSLVAGRMLADWHHLGAPSLLRRCNHLLRHPPWQRSPRELRRLPLPTRSHS